MKALWRFKRIITFSFSCTLIICMIICNYIDFERGLKCMWKTIWIIRWLGIKHRLNSALPFASFSLVAMIVILNRLNLKRIHFLLNMALKINFFVFLLKFLQIFTVQRCLMVRCLDYGLFSWVMKKSMNWVNRAIAYLLHTSVHWIVSWFLYKSLFEKIMLNLLLLLPASVVFGWLI